LANVQYTPPTPTGLNRKKQQYCRVESRRRCVRNSQLVSDSLNESEQIANSETFVSAVWITHPSAVVTQLTIVDRIRRQSSWASCDSVHTADAYATQLDSWVLSASAVCIGLKPNLQRAVFVVYK